jgi:hypothetical protein
MAGDKQARRPGSLYISTAARLPYPCVGSDHRRWSAPPQIPQGEAETFDASAGQCAG